MLTRVPASEGGWRSSPRKVQAEKAQVAKISSALPAAGLRLAILVGTSPQRHITGAFESATSKPVSSGQSCGGWTMLSKTLVHGSMGRQIHLRSIAGGRAHEPRTTPYLGDTRENVASEARNRASQERPAVLDFAAWVKKGPRVENSLLARHDESGSHFDQDELEPDDGSFLYSEEWEAQFYEDGGGSADDIDTAWVDDVDQSSDRSDTAEAGVARKQVFVRSRALAVSMVLMLVASGVMLTRFGPMNGSGRDGLLIKADEVRVNDRRSEVAHSYQTPPQTAPNTDDQSRKPNEVALVASERLADDTSPAATSLATARTDGPQPNARSSATQISNFDTPPRIPTLTVKPDTRFGGEQGAARMAFASLPTDLPVPRVFIAQSVFLQVARFHRESDVPPVVEAPALVPVARAQQMHVPVGERPTRTKGLRYKVFPQPTRQLKSEQQPKSNNVDPPEENCPADGTFDPKFCALGWAAPLVRTTEGQLSK